MKQIGVKNELRIGFDRREKRKKTEKAESGAKR